ncbi:MAG: YggS family pyridoxal phosphate-dependent enzyme [Prevotella sp.]|nr:YggS family pyridoxal phosphate-dependent enzyme [Prevotella sp.]
MATTLTDNLNHVRASLLPGVGLVAVSKFHPASQIAEAYAAGQRRFGESHEQELRQKHAELPTDIEWHFIGHLQTNKVKLIVPYITMIETVDSMRLLREIERQAARVGRTVKVLLELHLAQEATKYGLTPTDCRALLADGEWRQMEHVKICGLMMMASNVDDEEQIEREFQQASDFFDEVKRDYFAHDDDFCVRSWGMSADYPLAMRHGSTLVRVGTAIFGERV